MSKGSREKHHKIAFEQATAARLSYEPDYEGECECCGVAAAEQPLVTVFEYGRQVAHLGMCGVCTWGSAEMAKPQEWNE
jgi:hypothetical protein